ncbi:MAG: F0F1 ATP synthase subunit delta [Clostridia bacterium]|nr:F0F1 ATP synthase subunit delta [Clostridia bacterium]
MPLVEKRYAEALVGLAEQAGAIDDYQKDFQAVVTQFNELQEFRLFMLDPEVRTETKKDLIMKIFQGNVRPDVLNFILLLLDKGRIKYLSEMLSEFIKVADKKRSILNIRVISAAPLNDAQIAGIKAKYIRLYDATAAKVETEIDRNLIGGLKVIIGDKVMDGSLKGRLEELKQLMVQG